MGNGLFNDLGGSSWDAKRKMMVKFFTPSAAKEYMICVEEALEQCLSTWNETETVDILEKMQIGLKESLSTLFLF